MRARSILALTLVFAGVVRAQAPFPAIPGTNIGFNPNAFVGTMTIGGQLGLVVLNPGTDFILSLHDPALLPPATLVVELDVQLVGVFEPNACAVGAGVFLDSHSPQSTFPVATVASAGWSLLTPAWAFTVRFGNTPFFTSWQLTYCGVIQCTSPCGTGDRDPEWEAYFLTLH
jgi:hypothetical protein